MSPVGWVRLDATTKTGSATTRASASAAKLQPSTHRSSLRRCPTPMYGMLVRMRLSQPVVRKDKSSEPQYI